MDEGAFVDGYATQVGSIWVAIPILVVVVFGLWKLAKIVRAHFQTDPLPELDRCTGGQRQDTPRS